MHQPAMRHHGISGYVGEQQGKEDPFALSPPLCPLQGHDLLSLFLNLSAPL